MRADQRFGEQDAAVFAATAQLCALAGWDYQRAGELGPVHLRWLPAYRRFAQPLTGGPAWEVFAYMR